MNTTLPHDYERFLQIKPIGILQTCFPEKNGTPRQGYLCPHSRAILELDLDVINPELSLEGLTEFSHVWLLWLFSQNANTEIKTKIAPPRLQGKKTGLFSTRSPHRPNPIGLSLVKLDKVEGKKIFFSSVDIVNGTPIIDIKPYIHQTDSAEESTTPQWIQSDVHMKTVSFLPEVEEKIATLLPKLRFYDQLEDIKAAIVEMAQQDPRPVHYRGGKYSEIFGFCIDNLNVLSKFVENSVTIVDVEDWSEKGPETVTETKSESK